MLYLSFQFHQAMRSFVRAGYLLTMKEKKWTTNIPLENTSPLLLGLLFEKEYQNPLLVFKKVFKEHSIKEFDYFMSKMGSHWESMTMYRKGISSVHTFILLKCWM